MIVEIAGEVQRFYELMIWVRLNVKVRCLAAVNFGCRRCRSPWLQLPSPVGARYSAHQSTQLGETIPNHCDQVSASLSWPRNAETEKCFAILSRMTKRRLAFCIQLVYRNGFRGASGSRRRSRHVNGVKNDIRRRYLGSIFLKVFTARHENDREFQEISYSYTRTRPYRKRHPTS